jgi:hypothetical protein
VRCDVAALMKCISYIAFCVLQGLLVVGCIASRPGMDCAKQLSIANTMAWAAMHSTSPACLAWLLHQAHEKGSLCATNVRVYAHEPLARVPCVGQGVASIRSVHWCHSKALQLWLVCQNLQPSCTLVASSTVKRIAGHAIT